MKKLYRIKKNEEFSKIIKTKHYNSSASFVVYSVNKAQEYARVGISVSKKLGNAVERNKIKRQIRSMIHDLIDFNECQNDLIIIVKAPYLENDYENNKNDLEKVLKKAII